MNILGDTKQWFIDNGDYTHRLNYELNPNSVVFDLGGYLGWFTEHINNRYGSKIFCFEPIHSLSESLKNKFINHLNIVVIPSAISNTNGIKKIYLNNDASSMYVSTGIEMDINCVTLDVIMNEHSIDFIDLIKINIEGEEFSLLNDMINKNLHIKCDNIQVQFHKFINDSEKKYDEIKNKLEKTHELTYYYPFVWENWKLK